MIAFAALLVTTIHVDAPPTCLTEQQLDDTIEIDLAESVNVVVNDVAGDDDARAVTIDIALARVEPLHRELSIKPVECRDLPDLVALLIKEQRALASAKPKAQHKAPPPEPIPMHVGDDHRRYVSASSCDSTPDPCGCGSDRGIACCAPPTDDVGVSLQVGAGGLLSPPLSSSSDVGFGRVKLDVDLQLQPDVYLAVGGAIEGSPAAGAAVVGGGGLMWRLDRTDAVRIAVLGTVDVGYTSGHTLYTHDGTPYASSHAVLVPGFALRARASYVFLEVGALVWFTADLIPAPGGYVALGFYL